MSTAVTMTTFDAYLKEYYIDGKRLQSVAMYNKPALGLIPKKPTATGDTWVQALAVTNQVGDSATYASASLNASAGVDVKFYGTWKDRFAATYLQDKVLTLSRDAKGATQNAIRKMDKLIDQFKQSCAIQLYRDEGGSLAQLNLTGSAPVAHVGTHTLSADTDNMGQFIHKDMVLAFNTSATADAASATRTVATVNRQAGTFTVSAGGAGTIGTADYAFKDGDVGSKALSGFRSWVPDDAPTTTFKNVDRSTDPTALGGLRLAASGLTTEEALIQMVSDLTQYGSNVDAIFIHDAKFAQLVKELSGRQRWVESKGKAFSGKGAASFGFRGLEVSCGGAPVPVYADPFCPKERAYCVQLDTWCLESAGMVPHIRDKDGLKMLRQASENYIFEVLAYYELINNAPQWNGVVKFDV